jgi:hypothetical protein
MSKCFLMLFVCLFGVSQVHCPIYLVNVSSMSAGDVVATAKMQGKDYYTPLRCAIHGPVCVACSHAKVSNDGSIKHLLILKDMQSCYLWFTERLTKMKSLIFDY